MKSPAKEKLIQAWNGLRAEKQAEMQAEKQAPELISQGIELLSPVEELRLLLNADSNLRKLLEDERKQK